MKIKNKNKMRKSTKYISIVFAIALLITSIYSLTINISKENIKTRTKEIYKYTNKFNYDYKVNLIQNRFIKNASKENGIQAYVTDLMDSIDLNLNYEYKASKQASAKYKYSIVGKTQVIFEKNGEEQKIWNEEETLLEEKKIESTSDKIIINEKLNLNLRPKNKLISDFKQEMGLGVRATYIVELKVDLDTNVEDKEINVKYLPTVQIDLGDKTSKITGENNTEDTQYVSKEYSTSSNKNIYIIIIDIITIIVSSIILKYALKSKVSNKIRNEFKQELNRILKICDDRIVQINTKPVDKDEEVVFVKDFGEIVKVSEELFKPILYYFDAEKEEAWFSVVSGQTKYRYILKK